jgi:hypothetical protein
MYDIVQTTFLLGPAANGASSIAASQGQRQGYLETCLNGGTDPIGQHFGGFFPQMKPSLAGGDWTVRAGHERRAASRKANDRGPDRP